MANLLQIENTAFRSLINKVNVIWRFLFPLTEVTTVSSEDFLVLQQSTDLDNLKKISISYLNIVPTVGYTRDHGELDGLTDDDHPQYINTARGDIRYSLLSHNHDTVYEPLIDNPGIEGYYLTSTVGGVRYWVEPTSGTFTSDIPVTLSGSKSLGKYVNGDTIPAAGKTAEEVLNDIANEYIDPIFTSFAISGSSPVEAGTTLTGSRTFTWSINAGSATIGTIDIYDIDADTLIATGLTNDGSQSITITTKNLPYEQSSNLWQAIANTTVPIGSVYSNPAVIYAMNGRFYGVGVIPTTSAQVRSKSVSYSNSFSISIPQGETKIFFAYLSTMSDITNTSVKYVEGFNSNVGDTFTKSVFNVKDANNIDVSYKVYTCELPQANTGLATYNVTISQ